MIKHELGKWNLDELAKNPNRKTIDRTLTKIESDAKRFEKNKKSLNQKISSGKFLKLIHGIEDITEKSSMIGGYASLRYSENTQSDEATALLTRIRKFGSDIENRLLFFDLWWKRQVDEKNARRLMKSAGQFSEYLRFKRLLAKYSLSEPEEKIINTLDVTGASALVKLYDKITNAYVYAVTVDGKKRTMNREQLTTLVRNKKAKTREAAYKSLFSKFSENSGVTGEIYQNIVLNWRDEGIGMRGFSSPITIRNISNDIDDETANTLLDVCKKNSKIFQKYFLQKAKLLGMKKLRRYDLYAPNKSKIKEKNYSYDKSVKLVLESLEKFSPVLSDYANNIFKKNHVDSITRPGKTVGAFCSTPSPKITPYVLVNFTGKSRDVFTLAHEIGHAIHSVSASDKSILVSDASLPLAETASTFSEMLLYDKLSETVSAQEKRMMLSEKIDDFYATIGRQSFFTLFEMEAHDQIANSTTVDEISKTYLNNLNEQFGNSVKVSDDFGIEWSCIPHFHHAPFYCYAYAFGNLLALSLFQRYKKEGKDFAPTYIEILAAGGTKKPEKLLRESGMDITKPRFWQNGFDYIENQVMELAKLNYR
jgi:oligoendopeptidase F